MGDGRGLIRGHPIIFEPRPTNYICGVDPLKLLTFALTVTNIFRLFYCFPLLSSLTIAIAITALSWLAEGIDLAGLISNSRSSKPDGSC